MPDPSFSKSLEVWTLQNLLDASIFMGLLATGMLLAQARGQEGDGLTLKLPQELFRLLGNLVPDLLLASVTLMALALINPDVMADIKMAIPFYPAAALGYSGALGLRLFRDGRRPGARDRRLALGLCLAASLGNYAGFTFIAEGPSPEYLAIHPSRLWTYLQSHLRSNATPSGIEASQWVFWAFLGVFLALCAFFARSLLGSGPRGEAASLPPPAAGTPPPAP